MMANRYDQTDVFQFIKDMKIFLSPVLPWIIPVTVSAPIAGPNDPRKLVGNLNGRSPLLERIINNHSVQEYTTVIRINEITGENLMNFLIRWAAKFCSLIKTKFIG